MTGPGTVRVSSVALLGAALLLAATCVTAAGCRGRSVSALGGGPRPPGDRIVVTAAWRAPRPGALAAADQGEGLLHSKAGAAFVDLATGAELGRPPASGGPTVMSAGVAVESRDHVLRAYEVPSGRLLWSRPLKFRIGHRFVAGSLCASWSNLPQTATLVTCLDPRTGAPRSEWSFRYGSRPVLGRDLVGVVDMPPHRGAEVITGVVSLRQPGVAKPVWERELPSPYGPSFDGVDPFVLDANRRNDNPASYRVLAGADGRLLLELPGDRVFTGALEGRDGVLYHTTHGPNRVVQTRPGAPGPAWSTELPGLVGHRPRIFELGDRVAVVGANAWATFDRQGGRLLGQGAVTAHHAATWRDRAVVALQTHTPDRSPALRAVVLRIVDVSTGALVHEERFPTDATGGEDPPPHRGARVDLGRHPPPLAVDPVPLVVVGDTLVVSAGDEVRAYRLTLAPAGGARR
jgi:hypothetical protein